MCLDVCPPAASPRDELEEAVRLTSLWAKRQSEADRAPGQLVFGIAQGAADPELRRRSIEEITALGFDGHALGGLAIGESRETMFETTAWAAELLPQDRPRYFMGIGDPEGCPCPACTRFSRAYLRHLVNQQELLGHRLVTLHNLRFVLDLVAGARSAIERGELQSYKEAALARLQAAEVPT